MLDFDPSIVQERYVQLLGIYPLWFSLIPGVRSCEAIASETVAVDGFAAVGGSALEIGPVFPENAVRIG